MVKAFTIVQAVIYPYFPRIPNLTVEQVGPVSTPPSITRSRQALTVASLRPEPKFIVVGVVGISATSLMMALLLRENGIA
jgi:hypothetical protein